ncbi:MAG: dTDP-4-dehydrorhamnose reductase [Tetrasphaera sp.]
MTRWLVTGAGGMLAHDLLLQLAGADVTALTRAELDVTDPEATRAAVAGHDVIVNCAAYAQVDAAESNEGAAFAVNAVGAANLARAAAAAGARLVHVSTDYVFSGEVFSGEASRPYAEDAPLAPRTAYGRSKAAGEWAALASCPRTWVVRTAWLFGAGGPNFVTTMARLAQERDELTVVADQFGQPTWTRDVAAAIVRLVARDAAYGIWHATSQGQASWHDFAQEIFRLRGLDPERVRPIASVDYPRPAPRPAWSVLGHERWRAAGMPLLPPWRENLARALPLVVPTTPR